MTVATLYTGVRFRAGNTSATVTIHKRDLYLFVRQTLATDSRENVAAAIASLEQHKAIFYESRPGFPNGFVRFNDAWQTP